MTAPATLTLVTAAFGHRPFATCEAGRHGISIDRLQRAHRAGRLRRLARGVYVVPDAAGADSWHLAQVRAAALRRQGVPCVIGGGAAALRWEVPMLGQSPMAPAILVPTSSDVRTGMRGGIRHLHEDLHPDDVRPSPPDDVVTSPVRTAIDLIRHARLGGRFAVATMSIAQRRQWEQFASPEPGQLRSQLADPQVRSALATGALDALARAPRPGTAYVSRILSRCDPRLESVLEAVAWYDFIEAGLPLPAPQAWVRGASRRWYCVDFLWEEGRVIGEADGAVKYAAAADVMAEKARQADLEAAGYRFVRWIWADAMGERSYVPRVARALGDR